MNPLISVSELSELVDRQAVTVLDVRWRLLGPSARADYDDEHVPGAVYVDLDTELSAPPGEHGRHPLPEPAAFEAAMRGCGVSNDVPVVCYDFADGTSAARAWWLLRYFGHGDVRVLDGGYAAWVAAQEPVEAAAPESGPGDFVADAGHLRLLTARDAEDLARTGLLLDARARERYTGEDEPIDPVAGHVPGAVSAPGLANVTATGTFLDPTALRERFADLGVDGSREVGAYCGSGVVAAQEVLALEVAGFPAGLYADSWSGWITDESRPVATGDAPG